MTDIRILSNATLFGQTLNLNATSAGTPAAISIPDYGDPPEIVVGDFFPTLISVGIGQMVDAGVYERRHITIDLAPLGTPDTVTVRNLRKQSDGTPVGKIRRRGTAKAHIQLQDVRGTDALLFDYTATKAGNDPVEGVAAVTVLPVELRYGWGKGAYYRLAQTNGRQMVTPGRAHRKVHVTVPGLTAADLAARHSVSVGTITSTWLRDTVAIGAGSDGTSKYGEIPALALDTIEGAKLWNSLSAGRAVESLASNWLLFERGKVYPSSASDFDFGWGESRLHPIYVGAYGSGAKPEIPVQVHPRNGARNVVIEDLYYPFEAVYTQVKQCEFVILSNERSFTELGMQGVSYVCRGNTLINNTVLDGATTVAQYNSSNPGYWTAHLGRNSGSYLAWIDGGLIEGNVYDHNGWYDNYRVDCKNIGPRPPEIYSHALYFSTWTRDMTVQDNGIFRPSFVGTQNRSGGPIRGNLYGHPNDGYWGGRGATLRNGELSGHFSIYHKNIHIGAGFKDALWPFNYTNGGWGGTGSAFPTLGAGATLQNNATYKGRGISFQTPLTASIDNMILNAGARTPITSTDDLGPKGTDGTNVAMARPINFENGTSAETVFDNTIVYNWSPNHSNVVPAGKTVNTGTIEDATFEKYADYWLSATGSTKEDFYDALRAMDDPWAQIKPVMDWMEQKAGVYVAPRDVAATVTFAPNESGHTSGWRADDPLDWSTGDLPGTVAGDNIDLDGYQVHFHKPPENDLGSLAMGDGIMHVYGGRWSFTSMTASAGARIEVEYGGEFWCDGYAGVNPLTVDLDSGRFRNSGTWSNTHLTAVGEAEALLAYDSSLWTVSSDRTLQIEGGYTAVGFDGSAGGVAGITVAAGGTLYLRSSTILKFGNLTNDPLKTSSRISFVIGSTITGQTSGATAVVVDVMLRGNNADGSLMLRSVSGVFANGEAIHADQRTSAFNDLGPGFLANVAAVPVYTMPQIAEFRSGINGTTAPNVVTTFTCGGTLRLDVTGMANAAYDLVVADTVSGTFATVDVQGGTGTVSYTGTKVIFTKTA